MYIVIDIAALDYALVASEIHIRIEHIAERQCWAFMTAGTYNTSGLVNVNEWVSNAQKNFYWICEMCAAACRSLFGFNITCALIYVCIDLAASEHVRDMKATFSFEWFFRIYASFRCVLWLHNVNNCICMWQCIT